MAQNNLDTFRHSAAHLLAQAVLNLDPKTKLAIGPAIDDGFYYDFDLPRKINQDDLIKIEKEIKKLIDKDFPFEKKSVSIKKAREIFKNQPFKKELIDELEENGQSTVSLYKSGDFVDLCKGPHVAKSGQIKAVKLLSLAGAYWRGDEKNKMLTRIYGTAFNTEAELKKHLWQLQEAQKRDHRKISKELDFFSQNDQFGPGLILWHPKLSVVREEIESWWRSEHRKKDYQYVYTPHIGRKELWDISGHTGFYQDLMYPPMKDKRDDTYFLKPMNCNGHILIYQSSPKSYRDLPVRYCELGTVYRYELEGVRHGILRPRSFTQDDAHIICREDQVVEEIENVLDFALEMNAVFGFKDLHYELSLHDPKDKQKYVGQKSQWQFAEKTLREILIKRKVTFKEGIGEAKFYGPSIDLKAEDAVGRLWQGTTIQFDFNLPGRFKLEYTDQKGRKQTPFMIHRTLLGSMERFVGVLIEQYAGAFPTWLSPLQAIVLPITDDQLKPAQKVNQQLKQAGIRTSINTDSEPIGAKIRNVEKEKIPFILIIGAKEAEQGLINLRKRGGQQAGTKKTEEIIELIRKEIENKL